MEFKSLHSYLEYCFSGKETVSDSMIKEAKKQYRKLYLASYNTTYQQRHVQISFRVSKRQYLEIQKRAWTTNEKVTFYVRQLVLKNKETLNSSVFKLLVFEAVDIVEEAIEENQGLDAKEILLLLEQMQKELP